MVRDAIEDVTDRGDIVIDSFLGGGTTLIAAARAGRRFRGGDLDSGYVDVAILRWMRETGGQAILRATGEIFELVKVRRARGLPEPDRAPEREPETQTDERLLLSAMLPDFGDRDAGAPS